MDSQSIQNIMPSTIQPSASESIDSLQTQRDQSGRSTHFSHLARQIHHNLQYQHEWIELQILAVSPLSGKPFPRPLISGLPPRRIYVHPDDQVEELKKGVKDEEVRVEREWVLPTSLKENWSLQRFAEVFDAINEEPPEIKDDGQRSREQCMEDNSLKQISHKKRRGGKRLLLATLSDDSTVVYYIVHDGIVKPRQN